MEYLHFSTPATSVLVEVGRGTAAIRHWGAPLGPGSPDALAVALDWPVPEGGLDTLVPMSVLPELSLGHAGSPGVAGRRSDGSDWAPRMEAASPVADVEVDDMSVVVRGSDPASGLAQEIEIRLDAASATVEVGAVVTNLGSTPYELDQLLLTIPVPVRARELLVLGGRWSNEFRPERQHWDRGTFVVENRRGRTSHDKLPFMAAGTPGFSEEQGEIWAAHLGWSGNSVMRAEVLVDGRRVLQAGELFLPGEVSLGPGESHRTPTVHLSWSDSGLNGMSAGYHEALRSRPSHPRSARPVLLNTWEAVYFDQDLTTLCRLADRAAAIGVERFVLDDGWFHGRRHDRAGLGDWSVDRSVWPDGLDPLIEHVTDLGMEFGLWVEPEMVNPDSDLYREHPDWVLARPDHDPVLFRHQLVLDLARPEVSAHLESRLDALLSAHDISYLKWDMNRDLVEPEHDGRVSVGRQTLALYDLIDRVRAAHPALEIESCASGGARADFGILARTDRIWTSDCNDALDRQRIQRGFSYLFPPELMGAHIGPPTAHTTGRTHTLAFRAATAFFGHLGIEWNLLDASDAELKSLATVIDHHKRLRPVLHTGTVRRLDHGDPAIVAHGVIAVDRTEAVVAVAQVATSDTLATAPLRVTGLDPDLTYEVEVLSLADQSFGKAKRQPAWFADGRVVLTGRQLAAVGLTLPVLHPESALLLHCTQRTT